MKTIPFAGALVLGIAVLTAPDLAGAQVRWDDAPRQPGAGYNRTHYHHKVTQPRSILKGSAANRAAHAEDRFLRRLGPETRAEMRHRGDVARHSRTSAATKGRLRALGAPAPRAPVHAATRSVRPAAAVTSRSARAPVPVLRSANRVGKHARHLRTAKTMGKVAAGGLAVAGAYYVAEEALGVDIPDPFEAAEWTAVTLSDPRNIDRRLERLGHDTVSSVGKAARTVTNPQQLERNVGNAGKKVIDEVEKAGCKVGGLLGIQC
jgi:hypothetical protein